MTKAKLDKVSVQIAAMALTLSVLSSGFAIYQWWTTGKDEKIRATIDISNKYIEEAVDPIQLQKEESIKRKEVEAGFDRVESLLKLDAPQKIRKHYSSLEYISFLANKGKLDTDYLSQFVICDILNAPDTLIEAGKLSKVLHSACPEKETEKETDDDGGEAKTDKKTESSK